MVETYGNIRAWEKEDIVEAGKPNAAGWILPDGHNIHRRYPEVAILIPDTMGRACGGLCASCQRMYDFQSERLNFEFETLRPKESWDRKLRRLMTYFEEDTQLRDILITGGDALMSQNKTLRHILEAVYRMAVRKQRTNLKGPKERSMQNCNGYGWDHGYWLICQCVLMMNWLKFYANLKKRLQQLVSSSLLFRPIFKHR